MAGYLCPHDWTASLTTKPSLQLVLLFTSFSFFPTTINKPEEKKSLFFPRSIFILKFILSSAPQGSPLSLSRSRQVQGLILSPHLTLVLLMCFSRLFLLQATPLFLPFPLINNFRRSLPCQPLNLALRPLTFAFPCSLHNFLRVCAYAPTSFPLLN